jgi:hypothetical protein
MTAKQTVLEAIQRLPDEADYGAIADKVAFLAAIQEAEKQIDEGKVISNDEMKRRLESWTSS